MGTTRYAEAALARELVRVRSAGPGTRGTSLFRAAAALGQLVGGNELAEQVVEPLLVEAGLAVGLPREEAESHARRGLVVGAGQPRTTPVGHGEVNHRAAATESGGSAEPKAAPDGAEGLRRPPPYEVQRLWEACSPVADDPAVADYLKSKRGLDPDAVDLWDSARALPLGIRTPTWATYKRVPWSVSGHRLLFRTFDETGAFVTIRARCVRPIEERLKALSPGGFQVRGTVLACPLGVQLLRGGPPTWWSHGPIVVVEGEPDHLTWIIRQSDAHEQGPAVLGVFSGGWSPSIADRIPSGTIVVLRVHHDGAGDRYAQQIHATLKGRCDVRRSRPGRGE